jgi:hypothetical protein
LTACAGRPDNPGMNATVRSRLLLLGFLVALAALGPLGCSISTSPSDSSESSSDSSGSLSDSSRSSSGSSSPEGKEAAYRGDVRDYTAAYVKSGGRIADFDKKLGELARSRGITNWEENMATYEGIGRGLGKAGVNGGELDTYVDTLAGGDPKKMAAIRKGYESARA